MLIQALPGPEAEGEATIAEQSHRSSGLGDNRRVIAHDRTGHRRHQANMLGRVGHGTQDRPSERCVALFLDPGREVIRYGRKLETSLLGAPDVAHEISRAVLFRHQLVAELDHWCRLSDVTRRCPWPSARYVRSKGHPFQGLAEPGV